MAEAEDSAEAATVTEADAADSIVAAVDAAAIATGAEAAADTAGMAAVAAMAGTEIVEETDLRGTKHRVSLGRTAARAKSEPRARSASRVRRVRIELPSVRKSPRSSPRRGAARKKK